MILSLFRQHFSKLAIDLFSVQTTSSPTLFVFHTVLTRIFCVDQVNLVGGYYDAGDNVKFGLPMAFTVTMMAWSVIEYGNQLQANGELGNSIDAIKWGTDYFIKAHPEPNVLYGEV